MNRRQNNKRYTTAPHQGPKKTARSPVDLSPPARVLGIDAALRCTGYGLIEIRGVDDFAVVDCGVIRTSKEAALSECLRRLRGGVGELLNNMQPAATALESGFFHQNVKTAMVLGATRGVVISTIAEANIPIYEYAPRQIKQALCGHGNAGKHQIALMVTQLLDISLDRLDHDATDALAAALSHISLATRQGGLFLPEPT